MVTFFELWTLLEPKAEYANLFHHCRTLWFSWTPAKQEEVFLKIEKKKAEKNWPCGTIRPNVRTVGWRCLTRITTLASGRPKNATAGTWKILPVTKLSMLKINVLFIASECYSDIDGTSIE